jgi:propanol-preferring alcohol dehydrogenase
MKAMVFHGPGQPLRLEERPIPTCGADQVLIRVTACGVCRTDLHVIEGDLTEPALPLIPGHEIIGVVEAVGSGVSTLTPGQKVGVPWLGGTCGACSYCRNNLENLCDRARFTGYQIDGGYAEYTIADHRFTFPITSGLSDAESAPLLCAGLIGYRSLQMAGRAQRLGLYGFGAAAHIVAQVARHQGREVYAFTRPGDTRGQKFASRMGARWAGDSTARPPVELDAAILFAPAGGLVPLALAAVRKGGSVICAGIHMSQIPAFDYDLLWGERSIRSVANLTRRDGEEFLALAPQIPVQTEIRTYSLAEANGALADLRDGNLEGAAVLMTDLAQ